MKFIFQGTPKPLKRHRHAKGFTYDPSKDDKTALLYQYFAIPANERPSEPLEGSLTLHLTFGFPFPKSLSKKKLKEFQTTTVCKVTKPDLTNLIKLVEDAFNGILWKDDSQIVSIYATKIYAPSAFTEMMII